MNSAATTHQAGPVTMRWEGETDGALWMIDQTLLPVEYREILCDTVQKVWESIKALKVRGAPAIGVAASYGVIIGLREVAQAPRATFDAKLKDVTDYLASSRPTAVNLFWALDRMNRVAAEDPQATSQETLSRLLAEARAIEIEDREMCRKIGEVGAPLLADQSGVLTHCNAGGSRRPGTERPSLSSLQRQLPENNCRSSQTKHVLSYREPG